MTKLELRTGEFVEKLWATPLGEGRFRLENTPFYAYGLSFRDIVEATPQPDTDIVLYKRTIKKGGHRTIRVSTPDHSNVPEELIERLDALGSSCEGASRRYLCFDIPPEADFNSVVSELLTWNADTIIWEHVDPTWSELHPEDPADHEEG